MDRNTRKNKQYTIILTTAFKCLSRKGYANVSMRDIADEAGVALSQLHYYFKNKEGLFTEVIKMMIQQYVDEIDEKLKIAINTKEKTTPLVEYFNDLIKRKPELLKLFIDFTAQSLWVPTFRKQLKKLFDDLVEMIEKSLMMDTLENIPMEEGTPRSVAKLLLGALYGTSIQIILGSEDNNDLEALNMVELILK